MRTILILASAILVAHLAAALTPKVRPVFLEKFYSASLGGFNEKDEWAYYSLNFKDQEQDGLNATALSDLGPTWDLIIQVEQKGDVFSDPNLYVSFDDNLPTLTQYSVRCGFYGEDFCVISSKELKNRTSLTIGVFCEQECDFKLQTELTEELLLDTGRQYKLFFHAEQERIVRFQIPNDTNITTVEIKGINTNKFERFNMIMARGNELPTTDNALFLRPAWENGYVGKFTSDCSCFCRGCNYTILISTEKEGYITVGAKTSGQVIELKSTSADSTLAEVYDSVMYFHSQCYKYTVTNALKDLRIKIESFAGDPNLFVNPLVMQDNLGLSTFNSLDHFDNEELILTPSERTTYNATTGDFYICVFGNTAATYKLTVKNEDHDIFLTSGLSESGYVGSNVTQYFYYRDSILATPGVNVTFQLHVMTGKARLKAILCPVNYTDGVADYSNSCTISTKDMLEEEPAEKNENHLGSESEPTDTSVCQMPPEGSGRDAQVSCVFVVGIIGMAQYQTHYSVLLKVNQKAHYTILKEGVPLADEIPETTPSYYMVSINNPNVTKVTFQMTTIHGDPDVFISRTEKEPSPQNHEKRSIRCGIYPEQVEYIKEVNKTLEGDYYIMIYGFVQSTFSLVYFVDMEQVGHLPKVKLLIGQKQKGVLKSTEESMIYFFTLSNDIKEDVEIRLSSENGHFLIYFGNGFIPTSDNNTMSGDDREPIVFNPEGKATDDVTTYYVRVVPQKFSDNQTQDSAGMAYQYSIAFYEQGSFIHLVEGIPNSGVVSNITFDYYQIDIPADHNSLTYEFTLTPKSGGNPDLVLSMNRSNKFPTREENDFISNDQFLADSLQITADMLQAYEVSSQKLTGQNTVISSLYIGVYTDNSDLESSYSILMTVKEYFTPILLSNGVAQSGSVEGDGKKHYYFKTGSQTPLYTQLIAKSGDPNLQMFVITNLSQSMYEWPQYLNKTPDFSSEEAYEADLIYLDSQDPRFTQLCGSSCILLIQVTNSNTSDTSHYSLQISRDMLELTDGIRLQDTLYTSTDVQGRIIPSYKYYKFYKGCGIGCDMEIKVEPLEWNQGDMLLMVDVDKLPSKDNKPLWMRPILQATQLVIQAGETNTSDMYLIGIYTATQNVSYFVTVRTFPHVSALQLFNGDHLGMSKLYIGESPSIKMSGGQTRYFYYENWSNATLKIQIEKKGQIDDGVLMEITSVEGKYLPKDPKEFDNSHWLSNKLVSNSKQSQKYSDTIKISTNANELTFCVECFFIIKLKNTNKEDTLDVKLLVQQNDEAGHGFVSHIVIGKPTTVKLQNQEKALLNFKVSKVSPLNINLQYFNGRANMKLKFQNETIDLLDPKSMGMKQYKIEAPVITLTSIQITLPVAFIELLKNVNSAQIYLEAETDLHAVLLLSHDSTLQVLSEGLPLRVFVNNLTSTIESRYFTYLPPSPKFQLAVNTRGYSFGVPYTVSFKKFSSMSLSDRRNLIEKLPTQTWFDEAFINADFVMESKIDSLDLFKVLPIEMQNNQDILLVKIEMQKGNLNKAELDLTLSGSEIAYLQTGLIQRGHVSNINQQTYKIYEITINQELFNSQKPDLLIEVTPCLGRVNFYVSDDYMTLFTPSKSGKFVDIITESRYGKMTTRISDAQKYEKLYIGVSSSNELYEQLSKTIDSFFEIKTSPISTSGGQDDFVFDQQEATGRRGAVDLIFGGQSKKDNIAPDQVAIRWSPIYHKAKRGGFETPYEEISSDMISYQIFAGTTEKTLLAMNSKCAIEHTEEQSSIFAIYISSEDEKDREVILNRADLQNVKVIGVLAMIKDPETHSIVQLAYEPFLITSKEQLFGMKLKPYQIMLVVVMGVVSLFCLGFVVYCLRRKAINLTKRLNNEVSYQEQVSENF